MGWRGRSVQKVDGNNHTCLGEWESGPCSSIVYWREGEYCYAHRAVPERRCLDCGRSSRTGVLEYNAGYRQPMATVAWTQYREASGFEREYQPKSIKAVADKRQYLVVAPGTCRYCESANIAPLEFGMDQLPDGQATCTAWPSLDTFDTWHGSYTSWLNKAAGDPGITLRTCATCETPLATLKGRRETNGARLGEWDMGIRHPRVDLPDGHWSEDHSRWVHRDCADPALVAVAA
jgi:hypothetical protein